MLSVPDASLPTFLPVHYSNALFRFSGGPKGGAKFWDDVATTTKQSALNGDAARERYDEFKACNILQVVCTNEDVRLLKAIIKVNGGVNFDKFEGKSFWKAVAGSMTTVQINAVAARKRFDKHKPRDEDGEVMRVEKQKKREKKKIVRKHKVETEVEDDEDIGENEDDAVQPEDDHVVDEA